MKKILAGLIVLTFMTAFVIAQTGALSSDEQEKLAKGKQLFEAKCSVCHSIEKPLKKNFDQEKWNKVVNSMAEKMNKKGRGELTDEEKALIVGYLVNTIPPKK